MPGPADFQYLIVGGGLAAASAVDGILEAEPAATIGVITDEAEPPYQRPPLSKEFLQYPDLPRSLLYVKPEGWFEERPGVELVTRQKVLVLDPSAMTVTTARGNEFRAPRILLATGGRARRLDVPGNELRGVHTLRRVEDAESIRETALGGGSAVLVGAGFVGMELAASLRAHGVHSTVVEKLQRVWASILPPELSYWMRSHFEHREVSFSLGTSVRRFAGGERVEAVETDRGRVECDFAVVGVGMEPCDGIAADAGLAVADGIRVDSFGETSHPYIYAAGDVARFPDTTFGGHTRVEHWEHAREHGRLVGRNMTGAKEPYELLSYFFSRVFDLSLNVVGRPGQAERTVLWGEPGEGPCAAFGLCQERVCGVVLIDAPAELESGRAVVRARTSAVALEDARRSGAVSLDALAASVTETRAGSPGTGRRK